MNDETIIETARIRYGEQVGQAVANWMQMIDRASTVDIMQQLTIVNQYFNRVVLFDSDNQIWGAEDYWATPAELFNAGKGDCEDIAIAKYVSLRLLGVPDSQLRLFYVITEQQAHMVLVVLNGDQILILDNLISSIRPLANRPDLQPIFSFNQTELDLVESSVEQGDPTIRLSRWGNLLDKLANDGIELTI